MNDRRSKPDTDVVSRALALTGSATDTARSAGRRAVDLLRRLPGADLAAEQLRRTEEAVLASLKERMDRVGQGGGTPETPGPAGGNGASPRRSRVERTYMLALAEPPSKILADLLKQSIDQSKAQAYDYLFASILRELVPDEARILATLAQGGGHAAIQLYSTTLLGGSQSRVKVMENVTDLGKTACAMLHESGHYYVTHLKRLGLVESGPEEPALRVKYELLENSSEVRQAVTLIESRPRARARIQRETLHLSVIGRQLWNACRGDGSQLKLPKPEAATVSNGG